MNAISISLVPEGAEILVGEKPAGTGQWLPDGSLLVRSSVIPMVSEFFAPVYPGNGEVHVIHWKITSKDPDQWIAEPVASVLWDLEVLRRDFDCRHGLALAPVEPLVAETLDF